MQKFGMSVATTRTSYNNSIGHYLGHIRFKYPIQNDLVQIKYLGGCGVSLLLPPGYAWMHGLWLVKTPIKFQ
jgi:hypothetical protein